ncbi:hypothetical protein G4Y79_18650 [Phototrophicus methaneseepsis]|uniref:Uncharacterized protein n=1 Tax=Phototrophicus methaneseepsis TaxID=2710758 RepID=A0A7S8IDM4_9CHLR|nr:hypothetical protein [Phototrophicus methaneseepsis]QPC81691.1 hypothetical protein G4Y79_18650 [Phototrophicus methaneseepsis]
MNSLIKTYTLLAAGLRADPQFCLASAVVWLDPMWQDADEDWDVPHDEDGTIGIALTVTRKAFPDIYSQAVEAIRQGASYTDIDRLICDGITERGIPLENLEWIGFGVPMPAYGVELNDPDFYTTHPEVIPILACFGISPEPNPYHMTIPDSVYTAGRTIVADLEKHPDERYRQISWLMQWLWSSSGNSSIDLSYDEICEFQPLSWEKDEFEFAVAIIEEANGIMSDVLEGLEFLSNNPDLLTSLQRNIQRIYKALEKQGDGEKLKIRLKWPAIPQ